MALLGRRAPQANTTSSTAKDSHSLRMQASEVALAVAHEPSLGLCYIQEHVQKATPQVVALERQLKSQSVEMLHEHSHTLDISSLVKTMKKVGSESCDRIQGSIDRCLLLLPAVAEAQAKKRTKDATSAAPAPQPPGLLSVLGQSRSFSRSIQHPAPVSGAVGKTKATTTTTTSIAPSSLFRTKVAQVDSTIANARANLGSDPKAHGGIGEAEESRGASADVAGDVRGAGGSGGKPKIPGVANYDALQKAQMERLQKWLEEDEE